MTCIVEQAIISDVFWQRDFGRFDFEKKNKVEGGLILSNMSVISMGSVANLITALVAVVTAVIAIKQWKASAKIRKAEYLCKLVERFMEDDIADTMYMVDYSEEWYKEDFHNGNDKEKKVDKTLFYFSYVCYLYDKKVINDEEFVFFKYVIERLLKDGQMQDYLYNLYHFSKRCGDPMTFSYLLKYGKQNNFIDAAFYCSKNEKFHHYLNF